MPSQAFLPDKYKNQTEINSGGMGVLYKAYEPLIKRDVALKRIHAHLSGDPDFVERFLREASAMGKLKHDHIVTLHTVEKDQGTYILVMEFCPGGTLEALLRQHPRLPVREAVRLTAQLASALDHAHRNGIIHRDLKPANVLFDKDRNVKLTDFGIAAVMREARITQSNQVIGTVAYMSPEQANGLELDGRSDLFSLGIAMYEMLTGQTPYGQSSNIAIYKNFFNDREELGLQFQDQVPRRVQDIVRHLLRRRREDRMPTADRLVHQLNELLPTLPDIPVRFTGEHSDYTVITSDHLLKRDQHTSFVDSGKDDVQELSPINDLLPTLPDVPVCSTGDQTVIISNPLSEHDEHTSFIDSGKDGVQESLPPTELQNIHEGRTATKDAQQGPGGSAETRLETILETPPESSQPGNLTSRWRPNISATTVYVMAIVLFVTALGVWALIPRDGSEPSQETTEQEDIRSGLEATLTAHEQRMRVLSNQLEQDTPTPRCQTVKNELASEYTTYEAALTELNHLRSTLKQEPRPSINRPTQLSIVCADDPTPKAQLAQAANAPKAVEPPKAKEPPKPTPKPPVKVDSRPKPPEREIIGKDSVPIELAERVQQSSEDYAEELAEMILAPDKAKQKKWAQELEKAERFGLLPHGAKRDKWLLELEMVKAYGLPQHAARELVSKDGAPMVLIPAGKFWMGSPYGGWDNEHPRHQVMLDTFYMDKFEVTVARYAKFLRAKNGSKPDYWDDLDGHNHGNLPVVGVSWEDANAYCQWAGKRLPTEAEWEKAARGTDGRMYPWGNQEPSGRLANFGKVWFLTSAYEGGLVPVDSDEAGTSPYGLYHMAGNVWEWTADWYDKNYYRESPERNPPGALIGEFRVRRGGSWSYDEAYMRSATRSTSAPTDRERDLGFRCAQDIPK